MSEVDRVEEFKSEIAAMRLPDPATSRDRQFLWLGVILMVGGIALAIYAYTLSHGTKLDLQQRDAITVGLLSVCLTVTGAALFLRASLAQFLRFWLARLTYEQQAQTDRLVEALRRDGSSA